MVRMGHDSTRAALIYQHATSEADQAIAQALQAVLRASLDKSSQWHAAWSLTRKNRRP